MSWPIGKLRNYTDTKKRCSKCKRWKFHKAFGPKPSTACGLRSWCLSCEHKAESERSQKPERKAQQRDSFFRRKYGISAADRDARAEAQNGLCACCGQLPGERGLFQDHCHTTGKVRDLLCEYCNPMIGFARDNPELFEMGMLYLQKHHGNGEGEENASI